MSYPSNADGQLRALVERIERLEEEIAALNGDKSEVYKEAKGSGYDVKVLRKLIADRRKDPSTLNEFEALYDLYASAIGSVRAHVETIDEFDADGVIQ